MYRAISSSLTLSILLACAASRDNVAAGADRFARLPQGWSVAASVNVPDQQLAAFAGKLGGQLVRVSNTTLRVDGQQLKVNLLECKTDADAAKVHAAILGIHKGLDAQCPRDGKTVVELVANDSRLMERAYLELNLPRPKVVYEISFSAAPITKCDFMMWNKMFNACLARNESQIESLAKSFTFGDRIQLRNHGLGSAKSAFSFTPVAKSTQSIAGEVSSYSFANLPLRSGLPEVKVAGTISSEAFALTPSSRKAGPELLGPNDFWPSADPEIVALAKEITKGKANAGEKTAAILEWLRPGTNIRYAGEVTGSRYGVKQVLKQRYGHCWDFSDCCVTLCRAAGVPSRQVLGWLHGISGHVWAEVLVEGEGWRQVDPTAGMGCDCRYIPYIASESGLAPFVYTSAVEIKRKP